MGRRRNDRTVVGHKPYRNWKYSRASGAGAAAKSNDDSGCLSGISENYSSYAHYQDPPNRVQVTSAASFGDPDSPPGTSVAVSLPTKNVDASLVADIGGGKVIALSFQQITLHNMLNSLGKLSLSTFGDLQAI